METVTVAETTFSAPDIECDGCATAITKALSNVTGVLDVAVDVRAKTVFVKHEIPQIKISDALRRIGFPAIVKG